MTHEDYDDDEQDEGFALKRWHKFAIAAAVIAAVAFVLSFAWLTPNQSPSAVSAEQRQDRLLAERLKAACSSPATYERIKAVAFDGARRIGSADPANFEVLERHSTVRMEDPLVKSRDEALDMTQCTGRFILDLPPGAERGLEGERRLVADLEYVAQGAANRTGLVFRVSGLDTMAMRLAAFDMQGVRIPGVGPTVLPEMPELLPETAERREPNVAEEFDQEFGPSTEVREPHPQPAAKASPRPSFDCGQARTRGEKMVCLSEPLARLDRQMAAVYVDALRGAPPGLQTALRRSRDRFLAYRDNCPDAGCMAQAYRDRIDEIRDISAAY